jgi:hypothetical protein
MATVHFEHVELTQAIIGRFYHGYEVHCRGFSLRLIH